MTDASDALKKRATTVREKVTLLETAEVEGEKDLDPETDIETNQVTDVVAHQGETKGEEADQEDHEIPALPGTDTTPNLTTEEETAEEIVTTGDKKDLIQEKKITKIRTGRTLGQIPEKETALKVLETTNVVTHQDGNLVAETRDQFLLGLQ